MAEINEEDIKEFYDEVKPDEYKFDSFNYIENVLDRLNSEYGYDRYEYNFHISPISYIEVMDNSNNTGLDLMAGDTLLVDEDGNLSKKRDGI